MRAIVIRFGRLGDMLLLEPLLRHLHRGYGKACLLMGTGPWTAALYAAHPDVAGVIEVTARHRPLALSPQRWRMVELLRAHRDFAVHVCECEPRALDKIRTMLALAHVDPSHCTFLDSAPKRGEHWIERLLWACGRPPPACAPPGWPAALPTGTAPWLVLREGDRRDRDAWLSALGWRGEPVWLVQASNKHSAHVNAAEADADQDDKAWPTGHWADALRALHATRPDARILLCGSPAEAPLLDLLAARVRGCHVEVAARALPLRRLMAAAEMAEGMLSVDTGPAHVAAAMGCPLVVLFGAQPPAAWLPRSPTGSAVIALGGPPRTRVAQITPQEVVAALAGLPPRAHASDHR